MNIRPSSAIRKNYSEIAAFCKRTGEPVYLTTNGEGDLVVMDIEAFSRWEKMLALREKLLNIERERINGAKYDSSEDLDRDLAEAIEAAEKHHEAV